MAYREDLSNFMSALNTGIGVKFDDTDMDGKTFLSELVKSGRFLASSQPTKLELIDDPALIEQELSQRAIHAIVTESLRSSQCFIVCQNLPLDTKCSIESNHKLAQMRFCVDDHSVLCQSQCWQPRSSRAKNVALYGADAMAGEPWNIDLPEYLLGSYQNYKVNGIWGTSGLPPPSSILNPEAEADAALSSNFSEAFDLTMSHLPVCLSEHSQVGDYSKHGSKHDRLLPCTCGDWTSSETATFLETIGMSTASHKKELTSRCPKQLDKLVTRPLDHYLALCALDVHWPLKREDRKVYPGADLRCDEVRADVEQRKMKGLGPDAINRWFCGSTTGMLIRLDQHDWLAAPHIHGLDKKCEAFLKR
jgi:hypothetical protein